jgi:hypothetical protein
VRGILFRGVGIWTRNLWSARINTPLPAPSWHLNPALVDKGVCLMTVDTITKPCWVSCDSLWPRHFEDQRPDAWQHEGRPETSFLLSFVQETLGNIYYYSFLLPLYRSQSGEESGADGGCSPELSLCRSFKHSVCLPLTLLLSLILCLSLHYHSSCKCKLSMSFCENNDY